MADQVFFEFVVANFLAEMCKRPVPWARLLNGP
jgi:hypothetical protein